ncbi:amidase [Brevibacterium daeguense]|uniref:Amidase n=1 Tax=Brevibacterium daeguense TaxID=909936 RepID=A0ABP8EKQ0_9MICO|nr:amidase family protein [Brevibacterium daeguense]
MTSELTWLSTRELADQIATGRISAVEAADDHFERIDEVNATLNAVVTMDAEAALARAVEADAAFAKGERLRPLHGVPMTHKDTHSTAGMRTTLGSPIFAETVPQTDSLIIARLKAAGVNTTGKTNVPEFAAGSHTFNPVFGTTVNPYDSGRSAGGSSGGVGAVIAAGVQASGDGSDMGGSLRIPGSFNNVVGLRPSNGRIPHVPPENPWSWLSQGGFMARTVGDIALLMELVAGPAPDGPGSIVESGRVFDLPEFRLGAWYEPSLDGVRVAFAPDLGGMIRVESEVLDIVRKAAPVFEELGAQVSDECMRLIDADEVFDVQRAYDFLMSWGDLVRTRRSEIKESVVWNTERGMALTSADLVSKDNARARLLQATQEFFAEHDVLVTTTAQVLPFDAAIEYPTEINGRPLDTYLDWMRSATLISATGCPAISVPAGFSASGLPVGIQIVAAPGQDVRLLQIAHAFEEATAFHRRRPPV